MQLLFIGDIFGKSGRRTVSELLDRLIQHYQIDFCVANCENAAGGAGVTPAVVSELLDNGIDVLTSGNHVWDKKEVLACISQEPRLLRPANFSSMAPGHGAYVASAPRGVRVGVLNLVGRVFMPHSDCPFRKADVEIEKLRAECDVIVVDMHAEATSEKVAMGWYLDGRVSAVIGSHTHIQTADERILPKGAAYLTDVGMTGPYDSVLGVQKEIVLDKFLTQMPRRFEPAKKGNVLAGVVIDVDELSGEARSIRRLLLPSKNGLWDSLESSSLVTERT